MNPTLETCAAALRRNRFDVRVVATSEEALAAMKTIVDAERPEVVSFGDSMTMRATGVIEWLRGDRRFRLLDGFDPSMPRSERLEIRRQALLCDLFITGINAVTAAGTLHWLDMVGNRIAPVAFGPRKAHSGRRAQQGLSPRARRPRSASATSPLRRTWPAIPGSAPHAR